MNRFLTIKKFAIFILLIVCSISVYSDTSRNCAGIKNFTVNGIDVLGMNSAFHEKRMTKATMFSPSIELPPHCQVEGELDRRKGTDGKAYSIKFAINLPAQWNGRYLFQGGGGLNGTVNEPVGNQTIGKKTALARGFAVVSTDSGHQGEIFDASFMADQEAALNFFFLGNMRVTTLTKQIVEAYYQKPIDYSYFMGCSTGGREGMIMAQRFPYLYDGIVSGAPAIRTGLSNLALRWLNVQLNQAAEKGDDGLPLGGGTFSKNELGLIVDGLLAACDHKDGNEDGLIFNTAECQFDPLGIACDSHKTESCISQDKAKALQKAVAGPVDSRGVQVYSRFMYDTGVDDNSGFSKGLLAGGGVPPVGPPVAKMMQQNVDAEFIAATAPDAAIGDTMAFKLSSFSSNGGKHIFYHGLADPWFSAMDTVTYQEKMAERNGGTEKAEQFSRVFLVPGMGHCAGGEKTLDQFDMLTAITDWVEKENPPERIIATGKSMPGVSRPLCPYPRYPHYKGRGDKNKAENYECRSPTN